MDYLSDNTDALEDDLSDNGGAEVGTDKNDGRYQEDTPGGLSKYIQVLGDSDTGIG